jgi:Uma2 family endonuclease
MQTLEKQRLYTPEEYLALEEKADFRSEYINGQIIPMAGGSTNHNRISGNLYANLNFAFRQQNYEVFMADVRLWIPEKRIYTYPDAMVIVGEPEYWDNRADTITNPIVIAEVRSNSTKTYDPCGICEAARDDKFRAYRTIPSFAEYILIDQTQIYIEQYTKTAKNRWALREYNTEDEAIAFAAIPFQIALSDLYNKVQLPAPEVNS